MSLLPFSQFMDFVDKYDRSYRIAQVVYNFPEPKQYYNAVKTHLARWANLRKILVTISLLCRYVFPIGVFIKNVLGGSPPRALLNLIDVHVQAVLSAFPEEFPGEETMVRRIPELATPYLFPLKYKVNTR